MNSRPDPAIALPRRLVHLGLVVLCLMALTGCGPGMYGSTRPLIKIGLAAPFEGLGRPLGYEALRGVKTALGERNAAGGVGGYMVELVALNDSNRPDEAAARAHEFAADPAVVGVITGWSPAVATAALPAYRQAGLAVVVAWSAPAALADPAGGIVLLAADSERIARAVADRLATSALTGKVAVAGEAGAIRPYLGQPGLPAMGVPLPAGPGDAAVDDWARHLLLARTAPPAALVLLADGAQAGGIVRAVRATSWSGLILGGAEAVSPQLVDVAGTAADGVVVASAAPAGVDLAAGGGGDNTAAPDFGPRAVMAYDATQVLLAAVESAVRAGGQPTRDGVGTALLAVRVRGLTGDIVFGADGRRVDAGVWWYRIEGGRYPGRRVE